MAADATNRLENLRTLRVSTIDAAFATAFISLIGGAFLTGYIDHVGGNDFWINLVGALPALAGLFQILGGIVSRRFYSFKRYVGFTAFLWRACYLPVALLPFAPIPDRAKLVLVAIAVTLAAVMAAMNGAAYTEWLATLVPTNSRGFYFARRNAIASGAGASAGLVGALLLDHFKKIGEKNTGFAIVFGIGTVLAWISWFYYCQMADLRRAALVKESVKDAFGGIWKPFADRSFRLVLAFMVFFIAGQGFAGNLFAAFAIKSLELPYAIIQWAGFMHAIGNILAARFWGYLADKYGNKPVLMIVGAGLTLTPAMWLFCHPNQDMRNAMILLPMHILVGATWAGVALCQFNIVLATAKPEERNNYLAVTLSLQSVVGFISPMLGAFTLSLFEGRFAMADSYKLVFGVTMGLRLFALFWLFPVREAGATNIRRAVRDLLRLTPKGLKAIKQLGKGDDEGRAQALQSLAHSRTSMAIGEMAASLHDPSPKVRRQAARALERMADPEAEEALVHMLIDHPDLVEEETIEALGELGGERSVEPLTSLLKNPRSLVRRAAARALARLGRAEAIPQLIEIASQPDDPDLRRAALQALRALEADQADIVIADALFDPTPSVRIAAAEAVSEMKLERAAPYLRQSLSYYNDEATSEVAYALGVVGGKEDIPAILALAETCLSMITRRRCLLGVARILGVESEAYRLITAEGMARDQALITLLSPIAKGNKRLRDALELYSGGDEPEALKHLSPNRRFPEFDAFAERPVPEAFLVAAAFAAKAS